MPGTRREKLFANLSAILSVILMYGLYPEFGFIAVLDAVLDSESLRGDSFPELVNFIC